RPGETLIIPKKHVDHFTDLSDEVAGRIIHIAQRIGRALIACYQPDRVGYIVHGYGVAHAHFIVLPQHDPYDITSARFAEVRDGEVRFSLDRLTSPTRTELDAHAAEIRAHLKPPIES
ncbi:MAG: HIT family protein, partial [Longimicrobiales bacterium]